MAKLPVCGRLQRWSVDVMSFPLFVDGYAICVAYSCPLTLRPRRHSASLLRPKAYMSKKKPELMVADLESMAIDWGLEPTARAEPTAVKVERFILVTVLLPKFAT